MARVTFVVATYRRPDALRCTLESLRLQDRADWEAVVVGDCCEGSTEEAIRIVRDQRIAYFNLPQRFGEQSGPNTFGLALSSGEMVTFLNHDDLLLPDHVSYGLQCLGESGADFFVGKAANATRIENGLPVFTDLLPRSKDLRRLLLPPLYAFDPSSFWLVRTEYARRVGPWRSATRLWRTPLDDWLLRAWRLGGSFTFGKQITGLRLRTHYVKDGLLYDQLATEHEAMLSQLSRQSPDELRAQLVEQLEASHGIAQPETSLMARRAFSWLHEKAGLDMIALLSHFRGRKGSTLRKITEQRTGAQLPEPPDIDELIRNAQAYRIL